MHTIEEGRAREKGEKCVSVAPGSVSLSEFMPRSSPPEPVFRSPNAAIPGLDTFGELPASCQLRNYSSTIATQLR